MKRSRTAIVVAMLLLVITATYVYATSSNPTPEERKGMTKEQLQQIEPAYSGEGKEEPQGKIDVEDLMLEEIAPEDQKAVREILGRGDQPKLKKRSDGLLELEKK